MCAQDKNKPLKCIQQSVAARGTGAVCHPGSRHKSLPPHVLCGSAGIFSVSLFWHRYCKVKTMHFISPEENSLVCLRCNHTPVSQKYETTDEERGGD